jgi:hypothetical protein
VKQNIEIDRRKVAGGVAQIRLVANPGLPKHQVWVGRHDGIGQIALARGGRRILSGDATFDEAVLAHGWVVTRFRDLLSIDEFRDALKRYVNGDGGGPPMTLMLGQGSAVGRATLGEGDDERKLVARLLDFLDVACRIHRDYEATRLRDRKQ